MECKGVSGENGTCMTPAECAQKNGTPNGPCAGSYGTCCTFLVGCDSNIYENGTYFVNNGFPNTYEGIGTCQTTLFKPSPDICQFRFDFTQFNLMGPEPINNICNVDQFVVGGSYYVPPICGNNAGNHMYIDAGGFGVNQPIYVTIITGEGQFQRIWKIRVRHIPCNVVVQADSGCLQYYIGVSGQIRSYNYDPINGLQLSNQDYGICIRTERNYCSIHFSQCVDSYNNRTLSFTLTGNSNNPVPAMVGSTGSANYCQNDYLIIPMMSNVGRPVTGPFMNVDRVCGGVLAADVTLIPTTVRSSVKPFRLWYHTDSVEAPNDIGNRGFCLNYIQQPCSNNFIN